MVAGYKGNFYKINTPSFNTFSKCFCGPNYSMESILAINGNLVIVENE